MSGRDAQLLAGYFAATRRLEGHAEPPLDPAVARRTLETLTTVPYVRDRLAAAARRRLAEAGLRDRWAALGER